MRPLKTIDDYGFLLSFIGGIIIVINAIVGLILGITGNTVAFIGGAGVIGFIGGTAAVIVGSIVSAIIGGVALFFGLKLFMSNVYAIVIKIDLIITGIILIVLFILAMGLGAILVLIGGILILVYRFSDAGNKNPMGK